MKHLMQKLFSRAMMSGRLIGAGLLLALLMGCGEDPRQLFETAQFEEQQQNRTHARELYEQIIQEHPGSEYAEKARQRLEALKSKNSGGDKGPD
jgi:outer membrane protein assembly factor BamD (BamD/ComL family)